jgi:hypothetical protein
VLVWSIIRGWISSRARLTKESSDEDRWTTDSSLNSSTNDMSGSTATLRPTPQIVSNRDMFYRVTLKPHPPRNRTASSMSEPLHSEYDRIPQNFELRNRSHNLRPGFGTRPT